MITEILLFAITVMMVAFTWRLPRFIYLGFKIPKSSFNNSLTSLWDLVTGDTKHIFSVFDKGFEKSGLTRTWFGPVLVVNIASPEDVKIVLNSKECMDRPYLLNKTAMIEESLLLGHLGILKSHRKLLNPFFSVQSLRSVIPIFNRKVQILMDNLKQEEGKGEFNTLYKMAALTLETFLLVMEYDVDIQNQEKKSRDVFLHNLEAFMETVMLRLMRVWLYPDILYHRSSLWMKMRTLRANCSMKFAPNVLKQARLNVGSPDSNEKPETFIRALVDPRNNLSESELHDEVTSLIMAAQDTSSKVMATTLLMLGMHKDIQSKVVDELRQVLGKSPGYLDIEQLNELKYLEMTINETMRLLAVAPIALRINEREVTSSEGFIIPARSILCIPIFKIHRSEEFWGDDADRFKPERFSKENIEKIHPYAFFPFLKGPRMCLGWRYSMFLMKILLANVLTKYEVDTSLKIEEIEFKINILLSVEPGFNISIKERVN